MTTAPRDRLYTVHEVADACGITRKRVYQLIDQLKIGRKIGRDWLFTDEDIEIAKARNTKPGRPRADA